MDFSVAPVREFDGFGLRVDEPSLIAMLSLLFWICWLWALYEASISRTPPRRRGGRATFVVALGAWLSLSVLAPIAYGWRGTPPWMLLVLTHCALVLSVPAMFVSVWLAAKALREFEQNRANNTEWDPLLPILLNAFGIWFIHRRIQNMLAAPRLIA